MKHFLRIVTAATVCLFSFLLTLTENVAAQTATEVLESGSSAGVTAVFNPSIAVFPGGSAKTTVVAYTRTVGYPTATGRTVEIKRSTDDGSTWSVVSLPMPKWNASGVGQEAYEQSSFIDLDNMDEPQLLHTSGQNLLLVVRGWLNDGGLGDPVQEQLNSIHTKAGIYLCFSTDGGSTWGYYKSSSDNTVVSGWHVVEQNYGTDNTTLECPRIAFRKDFGKVTYPSIPALSSTAAEPPQDGYITWTKKTFNVDVDGTLSVASTDVCVASVTGWVDGTGIVDADGHRYAELMAGDNIITEAGRPSPMYLTLSGERSSVAVSPDGHAWVSYYSCSYDAHNTSDIYLAELPIPIGSGAFGGTPRSIATGIQLPGAFDVNRGYLYASDFSGHIDLAQGPSIQIACKNPQFNCLPDYQVGVAYTYVPASEDPTTSVLRDIAVLTGNCNWGGSESSITFIDAGGKFNDDGLSMSYFPVLSYAEAKDALLDFKTLEGISSGFAPSYFLLTYMKGENSSSSTTFSNIQCLTGFSYNNSDFKDVFSVGSTGPSSGIVRTEDEAEASYNAVNTYDYMGCQIGTCGFSGDLTAYPAWTHIQSLSSSIEYNTGGAYIVRPYLRGMPGNDPDAFPSGHIFSDGTGASPSLLFYWSEYHYFKFDQASSRPTISAPSTIATPNLGTWEQQSTPGFILPSGFNSNYGLFYAVYEPSTKTQGLLHYSDQRKAVSVGNVSFVVYEQDGKVYVSESCGLPPDRTNPTAFDQIPWTEPFSVDDLPVYDPEMDPSRPTQTYPTIGVYQQGQSSNTNITGDASNCSGQAAIAVCWTENSWGRTLNGTQTQINKIKMRVREFDACTGFWGPWSQVYTIHSHSHSNHPTAEVKDVTTAVVSPIVRTLDQGNQPGQPFSDELNPTPGVPTALLGWSVAWISPTLVSTADFIVTRDVGLTVDGVESIVDIRSTGNHNALTDEHLYSRNWMRVDPAGNQIVDNSMWGVYPFTQHLMPAGPNPVFYDLLVNPFVNYYTDGPSQPWLHLIGYPSMTSSENKYRWWTSVQNYRQEIAFSGTSDVRSTDPDDPWGVWHTAPVYSLVAPNYGDLIAQSTIKQISSHSYYHQSYDRNPNITINSSGQVFVAWEAIAVGDVMDESLTDFETDFDSWMSEIVVRNTDINDPDLFLPIRFVATVDLTLNLGGEANDLPQTYLYPVPWKYLLNPSITGFPKTRTLNGLQTDLALHPLIKDNDFGSVELLFCYQNLPVINNHPGGVYQMHYFEAPHMEGVPAAPTASDVDGGDWPGWGMMSDGSLNIDPKGDASYGWTQKSHSPRQHSPNFLDFSGPDHNSSHTELGSALELANSDDSHFTNFRFDSYKTSADQKQTIARYRSESLDLGGATSRMTIGELEIVNELGTSRHIGLGSPYVSTRNAPYSQYRDSVFHSQPFDLATGEELSYDRVCRLFRQAPTAPGSEKPSPSSPVSYQVELVRPDGTTIPLEQLRVGGIADKDYSASRCHIRNMGPTERKVYLHVSRLSNDAAIGVHDSDGQLSVIQKLDGRFKLRDATLSPLGTGFNMLFNDHELSVTSVFPNPVTTGSENVISFFARAVTPIELRTSLVDLLGRQVGTPMEAMIGSDWRQIRLQTNLDPGTYFLILRYGNSSKEIRVQVVR